MALKRTGAEFNHLYNAPNIGCRRNSPLPTTLGTMTSPSIYINGVYQLDGIEAEKLLDADEVKFEGGVVFGLVVDPREPSFVAYFKRWKKAQTTVIFAVECDRDKIDAVKQAIADAGGKVVH